MQKKYIILTGGKNNAGDHLIKYRAMQLFRFFKPNAEVIDLDAWKLLTDEQIEQINSSTALILTGGPSFQKNIRKIYPLTNKLSNIKVPILSYGVGWKSEKGDWESSNKYTFDAPSHELLERINSSGFHSSVRDYHTLNALFKSGYSKFLMTGCPALYSLDNLSQSFSFEKKPCKIAFSLGVEFLKSYHLEKGVKDLILELRDYFKSSTIEVVFHHKLDLLLYEDNEANKRFVEKHIEIKNWLQKNGIATFELENTAESIINYYSTVDFHLGYRVHAHILMSSTKKPSVLITEDGRGTALLNVLGGLGFNGVEIKYNAIKLHHNNPKSHIKLLNKIYLKALPKNRVEKEYLHPESLNQNIIEHINYELMNDGPRFKSVSGNINLHFEMMKKFFDQLP